MQKILLAAIFAVGLGIFLYPILSNVYVEYFQNQGIEKFKKTQDLNKYLLEKNVIKKEDKIYLPTEKYSNLLITEMYKGKPSGIKFNNDFISWIEKEIFSKPIQGELF